MSDVKALVAEAREFADRNNGLNWQRMVRDLADALEVTQQAPAVNADGPVGEIRAAYVEYAESAEFPTQKHYEEWKAAGGAEKEFDSMIAEVEARGLEKAARIVDVVVLVNGGANKDKNEAAVIAADDIRARAQQVREGNA